ncbi:MAG TPA: YhcH/YjgK/YiaL family protein [Candidatus Hydrogenedentes bacterium]|nr:YhcH/YjgK/YiaL family protein [Candidatus Hydrogenedentota bacterium]HPG69329.1 YhcH/YjgK/YiaL family protein [Candidatus Hydrogenedentota bacterium]
MILDRLEQAQGYETLHPRFAQAFAFLKRDDLTSMATGRYAIDGDNLYAIVDEADADARPREKAALEAHRKYIDIQFIVSGNEQMGWRSRITCRETIEAYNPAADIEFFGDGVDSWVAVPPGCFAIFFTDDAHAPLVGAGRIRKVVVKVALGS